MTKQRSLSVITRARDHDFRIRFYSTSYSKTDNFSIYFLLRTKSPGATLIFPEGLPRLHPFKNILKYFSKTWLFKIENIRKHLFQNIKIYFRTSKPLDANSVNIEYRFHIALKHEGTKFYL